MSKKTIQLIFLLTFTAILLTILFFVFKPYFGVVFISGILAVSFYPLYEKLTAKFGGRKSLASGVSVFLIFIFIIIPVVLGSALLIKEAADLYNSIALNGGSGGLISRTNILINEFNSRIFPGEMRPEIDLRSYVGGALSWITGHFDSIFTAVFGGLFNFILMLISLFYFFISGENIKKLLIKWSPLPDKHDEEFIQTLKLSVDAVLHGRILVSVVQGVFIGAGFAIFGAGSPVLWGFIGALASLIPILGTSVITVPATVYLFLSGNFVAGIGMLIWSVLAVGLVDNVISVVFLKGRIKVHPLIILFSILGGVEVFGAIGLLAGPVAVSAAIAVMNVYPFVLAGYRGEGTGDSS